MHFHKAIKRASYLTQKAKGRVRPLSCTWLACNCCSMSIKKYRFDVANVLVGENIAKTLYAKQKAKGGPTRAKAEQEMATTMRSKLLRKFSINGAKIPPEAQHHSKIAPEAGSPRRPSGDLL